MIGIVGQKRGMTRIFTGEGKSIPVTVIETSPNKVAKVVDLEAQGYRAIQVSWGEKRRNLINKPFAGNLAKAEIESAVGLVEFRLNDDDKTEFATGQEIKVEIFENGQKIDVTGTTIGKGFAGVVKRHNFRHQRNSHGNSKSHRAPGSIGQNTSPGRVFKGKRMAGHMGDVQCTIQNLEVVRVDTERNLLLIKGAVPGARDSKVVVKPSIKATNKEQ